jgi:hypothetical protein
MAGFVEHFAAKWIKPGLIFIETLKMIYIRNPDILIYLLYKDLLL